MFNHFEWPLVWVNALCLGWFLVGWCGYSYFAKYMATRRVCLASALRVHRINWMRELIGREMRVADSALMGTLERHVTFFASTTILILAGLLAVVPNVSLLHTLLSELSFIQQSSETELQLRLLLLVCVFIYAFFTFTWSMRQYGFCSVLIGAAPFVREPTTQGENYARRVAKLLDQAGHSYNYGLRAYYFAMSILAWFVNPALFVLAVTLVITILYRREFHSKPVAEMMAIIDNITFDQTEAASKSSL